SLPDNELVKSYEQQISSNESIEADERMRANRDKSREPCQNSSSPCEQTSVPRCSCYHEHLNEYQVPLKDEYNRLSIEVSKTNSTLISMKMNDTKHQQNHARNDEWFEKCRQNYELRKRQIDVEQKLADERFEQKRQELICTYKQYVAPKVEKLSQKHVLCPTEINCFKADLSKLIQSIEHLQDSFY
ncbi:unnamed protein product, partial [Didymodactylos carnosus]